MGLGSAQYRAAHPCSIAVSAAILGKISGIRQNKPGALFLGRPYVSVFFPMPLKL
jgi:hypothetical protein